MSRAAPPRSAASATSRRRLRRARRPEAGGGGGQGARLAGGFEVWVGSRFDWSDPVPQAIFGEFRARHPELRLDLVVDAKEQDGSIEKFTAAVIGGSAPDFAHVPPTYVKDYADKGWLADLDPYFKRSRTFGPPSCSRPTSATASGRAGARGHLAGDLRVLYNNARVWRGAGLDATEPTRTWDEWDEAIRKLLVRNQSGDIQRLGYNPAGQTVQGFMWAFWSWAASWPARTPPNHPGRGSAAVKAFEWMLRVTNAQGGREAIGRFHVANGSIRSPQTADYNALFINGHVGTMLQTFANRNEILRKNAPDLDFGWMDVPLPAGGKRANYGGGRGFAVPPWARTGRPAGPSWSTSARRSRTPGSPPASTGCRCASPWPASAFLKNDPFLKDMVAAIPSRKFVLVAPYAAAISGWYGMYINAVLDGRISPRDAVTEWSRLLQAEADKWAASRKR